MENMFTKPVTKQDDRPLYKKKRVIIPAAVLLFGFIGSQVEDDEKQNSNRHATPQVLEQTVSTRENVEMDLKTKVINNIKSIDGGDDLTKSELNTATGFQIAAAIFSAYAITINEARTSEDKEILQLTNQLEEKVKRSQLKNFPKLRKAYYEFVKETLWENDIDVRLSGNGNTVILFTGAYFAANKNIKETQESLNEMLRLLRFKQAQYRWYRGQDDFTFYSIASLKDNQLSE